MPKCHKIYPNCLWQVPREWFGSNFNLVLLNKVYWNYAIHIVRVCVSLLCPINRQLHVSKKNIIQVKFGSRYLASLYELLCHHFLRKPTCCLRNRFPNSLLVFLRICLIVSQMKALITNPLILLTSQFLHSILTIQPFSLKHSHIFYFSCNSKFFPQRRAQDSKKGRAS